MRRLIVFIVLLVLCSCANRRINQFSTFADAGSTYTEAMVRLTTEAGNIVIDADSEELLRDRDQFTQDERGNLYFKRTRALETLLSTIRDIRVHTSLLNRYFMALSQLASSRSPASVTGQLSAIVTSMEKIHPDIENSKIGNASVKDFMGSATPLVISGFKRKKLEDELRKNAGTIERELELQNALLKALSEQLKTDMEIILNLKNYQHVAQPYISSPKLPDNWKEKRKEILTSYLSLDAADKAREAAGDLKTAFLDLLENKTGSAGFKPLFEDINAMIDLIELVAKNGKK